MCNWKSMTNQLIYILYSMFSVLHLAFYSYLIFYSLQKWCLTDQLENITWTLLHVNNWKPKGTFRHIYSTGLYRFLSLCQRCGWMVNCYTPSSKQKVLPLKMVPLLPKSTSTVFSFYFLFWRKSLALFHCSFSVFVKNRQ